MRLRRNDVYKIFYLFLCTVCTVVNNSFIIYYNTLIEYFTCLQFIIVSLLERLLKCGLCFYIRLHTRILLLLIVNNNQGWAPRSFPFGTFRSFLFKRNVPLFSVLFSSFG